MKNIRISFQNCFGIRKLDYDFDTRNGRTFLLYAPNGSMKSSFANIFKSLYQKEEPSDRIFPHRKTVYSILDENDKTISNDCYYVIEPFKENYVSDRTSTLLVNKDLKDKYDAAIKTIDNEANQVLRKLSDAANLRKDAQHEIALTFNQNESDLYSMLEKASNLINENEDPGFSDINYPEIFNEKVLNFLESPDIRFQLSEYVNRYDQLISNSKYFRKGIFDHNNASNVSKSLKDNRFFDAKHRIILSDNKATNVEVKNQNDFNSLLQNERDQILNDPELASKFDKFDKAITKNIELRNFRQYIEKNPKVIPELIDLDKFRKRIWISYFISLKDSITEFEGVYKKLKGEISSIILTAKKEYTEWNKVVDIFHDRFIVPFTMQVINQEDVILKDATPTLLFKYQDGTDTREIGSSELFNVLSTGEMRALYLLNIIFDIESLNKYPNDNLLIFDDIADSFDYKNKYAIIG